MRFQFTHSYYLLALIPTLAWVLWFAWKSDVQLIAWRRWTALGIRLAVLLCLIFAIAGVQWLLPVEGMNVFFVLDRSESIRPRNRNRRENMSIELEECKE